MSNLQWGRGDVSIVIAESPQSTLTAYASPVGRGELVEPVPQQSFQPIATQASNLFESVVAFVGDGCGIVDDAQYHTRLEICRECDRRTENRCSACGCFIRVKARGRIFRCRIGRWE